MQLAENLKQLRTLVHQTQKDVAESVGISVVALQNYERGSRTPPLETLIALADLFKVSLDQLVGRKFTPARTSDLESRVAALERKVFRARALWVDEHSADKP